jgi:NAD(P)-dependent dehydrogenase (short-subunit alcohol dehydrogenase family)
MLGNVRMIGALLPSMLERRSGYIVNTASTLVIRPNPVVRHLMPYVASKGAVLAWTYALRCAMKPHGIGVSLFCPGLTSTRGDDVTHPQRMGWFDWTPAELTVAESATECATRLLEGRRRTLHHLVRTRRRAGTGRLREGRSRSGVLFNLNPGTRLFSGRVTGWRVPANGSP